MPFKRPWGCGGYVGCTLVFEASSITRQLLARCSDPKNLLAIPKHKVRLPRWINQIFTSRATRFGCHHG
jgi:hypothetical protein